MMFEVMAFKFCPIHIKHQTFNFKLTILAFSCFGEFLDVGDDFVDRFGT